MSEILDRVAASLRFRWRRWRDAPRGASVPPLDGEGIFRIPQGRPELVALGRDALADLYWSFHPRFQFFKSLPPEAMLLDLGAGSGGLSFWRDAGSLPRPDIRMFALDRQRGEFFGRYEGAQVADLDTEPLAFADGYFDAVIASHVFEHLADPAAVLAKLHAAMKVGGRAYVEVPSPGSKDLPRREEFVARGWPMTISNFHDDCTHRDTFTLEALSALGGAAGFGLVAAGAIENPLLADTLLRVGLDRNDAELVLFGFWARTRWAQFVILEKQDAQAAG